MSQRKRNNNYITSAVKPEKLCIDQSMIRQTYFIAFKLKGRKTELLEAQIVNPFKISGFCQALLKVSV